MGKKLLLLWLLQMPGKWETKTAFTSAQMTTMNIGTLVSL